MNQGELNATSSPPFKASFVSPSLVKVGIAIAVMSDGRLSTSSMLRVWALLFLLLMFSFGDSFALLLAFGVRRES